MNKKILIVLYGGVLLINNTPSRANTFYLYSAADNYGQHGNIIGRTPKHPLAIDVTNHIITVPNEVWGYSLTLISKEGYTYNYFLSSNKLFLSKSLKGEFKIAIGNNDITYLGILNIENN